MAATRAIGTVCAETGKPSVAANIAIILVEHTTRDERLRVGRSRSGPLHAGLPVLARCGPVLDVLGYQNGGHSGRGPYAARGTLWTGSVRALVTGQVGPARHSDSAL